MATTKKAIAEAEQAAEIKETTAMPITEPEAPAVTLDELEGMDMNMFDAEETESAPRPVWRITDDGCADWACQKIAEEKAELDRIKALGESQIEKIQQRLDAAQRRYENGTRFLTGKLAEYFETVPHKMTKTKHSYRPSLRHFGEENRRQHHETGRRRTAGLPESLRQRGHDPEHRKAEVGRVQKAARNCRRPDRRQNHRRAGGGRADH